VYLFPTFTTTYSAAVNPLSHVLLMFSFLLIMFFHSIIGFRDGPKPFFLLCFIGLSISHSLSVFFLSFGSAFHSYGFRPFSTSQTEGLLLMCSIHIIVIIFNATIFFHHKVKLFNLLLLLPLQHKFAPRAPPRLVPKKEVKTYGLFCLMIVCGVVQFNLVLLLFLLLLQ